MNLFSNIFKKNKFNDDYFISLDIGSEIVKSLVLRIDRKMEKVFIIGFGQAHQEQFSMQGNKMKNIESVVSVCRKAIDDSVNMARINPQKVIIGMNGEFIKTMTVKLEYLRNNSKIKIDTKEIKNIFHQAKLDSFKKIKKTISKEEIFDSEIEIASTVIADICIDGYRVISPVGFKGKEICLKILNSILSCENFENITKIAKKLNLEIIDIISEPYAVAMSIGVKETIKFNAILVDIGGKTTDVVVIREGDIKEIKVFNLGGRTFTKSLVVEFGLGFAEAEKLKIDYSNGNIEKKIDDQVKKIINRDFGTIFTGIKLSFEEFLDSNLLPFKMLFYGGSSQLLDIKQATDVLKIESSFINIDDIDNVIDETGGAKNLQYISSISLASFVLDSILEEDLPDDALKNMIKLNLDERLS